jgi:hypothetical protein
MMIMTALMNCRLFNGAAIYSRSYRALNPNGKMFKEWLIRMDLEEYVVTYFKVLSNQWPG